MAMTLSAEEQNRVNNVYNEREKAIAENESMYNDLINQQGALREQQNQYLAQQEQLQNENLNRQYEEQSKLINQQKEEAKQNKRVEEVKALNDYTAYTNPYGIGAEKIYAAGLGQSGVTQTQNTNAYLAYQNRVSQAGKNYDNIIAKYNLELDSAKANNDVQKAQNALNKLKLELQNNQDYYSNVASLSQQKMSNSQKISSTYLDQYNTVYNQILNERKLEEDRRQFNENLKYNYSTKTGNTLNVNGNESGSLNGEPTTTIMVGATPYTVPVSQKNNAINYIKQEKENYYKNLKYNDTGATLDGKNIYKASDGNYYYKSNGSYSQVPVVQETGGYLMLNNGEILVK